MENRRERSCDRREKPSGRREKPCDRRERPCDRRERPFDRREYGTALNDASGTGVISFSETLALAVGETYRLTAHQSSGGLLDITSGELLVERLG